MNPLFEKLSRLLDESLDRCAAGFVRARYNFDHRHDSVVADMPHRNRFLLAPVVLHVGFGRDFNVRQGENLRFARAVASVGLKGPIAGLRIIGRRVILECQNVRTKTADKLLRQRIMVRRKKPSIQRPGDFLNPGMMEVMVIKRLIERVGGSAEQTRRWRDKYPGLLVAERVKPRQLPEYNRRRQALDWVRQECPGYRLVQDGFLKLGYPRLETVCEEAGGFSHVREPRGIELELIRVLEELTSTILDGFFGDGPLPPCKVIDSQRASWEGMTVTLRLSEPRKTRDGFAVRYRLPWVALKNSSLTKEGFPRAFSTYMHERAHCFGGDQSAAFSLALTRLLQITLKHGPEIARAKAIWDELWGSETDPG